MTYNGISKPPSLVSYNIFKPVIQTKYLQYANTCLFKPAIQ